MNEISLQIPLISDDAPKDVFGVTREAIGVGKLLHAKVSYLPFKDEAKAKQYYSRFFLDQADKIISFIPRTSRSIDGKIETDVLVELGLNRLPPKKKTAGKVQENYKRQLQTDNYILGMIEALSAELIETGVDDDPEDQPDVKRWKAHVAMNLTDLEKKKKRTDKVFLSLGDKPAYTVVEDEYLMTSEILSNT